MSDKAKELEPLLRELYDDDDYVQGVIANAVTDDNCEIIREFIEEGKREGDDISADDILGFALMLGDRIIS